MKTKSTPTTPLTLRVQARGGKFLGDDIGGASIVVRNARTSEVLASGATRGNSGNLVTAYQPGASRLTFVTPGRPPTVSWLTADDATSKLVAELPLTEPTPLEITAFGPLGGLQSAHTVTATQWIVPGERIPDPGFVIELPGLLLQVLEPPTHHELPTGGGTLPLAANVTMMCGCPINQGEPWLPSDFEVSATIQRAGSRERVRVPLAFAEREAPSRFRGEYKADVAGDYEVTFTAVQKSTGNAGTGRVTFIVPEG